MFIVIDLRKRRPKLCMDKSRLRVRMLKNDLDITLTSVEMMACLVEGGKRENLPSPLGICIVCNDILVCNILLSIVIIVSNPIT